MVGSSSLSKIRKDGISGASSVAFNSATSIYHIYCEGKVITTTVTDKTTMVDQWVQDINVRYSPNSSVIVGFDVECKPSMIGCNFLMNPNFFFVGFDVADNISKIMFHHGLNFGGVYADIKELVMEKWPGRFLKPILLKDLAKDVVGLSIKKPKLVSLNNWEARVLSIEYGCIHVYVSYKIGHKILRDD
ncbi:hypothetical protein PIB30_026074 [Stylosanthes scabra]|uniref:3'-5' exonuclease domain-containing protein n=1 Tax=Stylosanthes scabra TaxID=79078 RepID=A0ABU6YAS8_9FABA|nr:hypothetical protein [Stylosanthes scabra]